VLSIHPNVIFRANSDPSDTIWSVGGVSGAIVSGAIWAVVESSLESVAISALNSCNIS
jgi:hypothetical protein